MAASLSLTQLSSGNPVYDKYYRQVDPSGSGRVGAADAAQFLKKSELTDLVLGKIWDLADAERKGYLNKQQFFIALRLVACAQNGLEVALKSLDVAVPPPKFLDTSSPLLVSGAGSVDSPWVVKTEEKLKYDVIFDSLLPMNGMLSGEKVKPVLLNSKLPVDVLGRVWELSDIDRDGMLDRDEFAVAMYLVYRALEKEPVPMSLPAPLVPPSKRKKTAMTAVVPLLPSPPSIKDSRHSVTLPKTLPPKAPALQWVVSPVDKAKYDDIFAKTDKDKDGLVSGPEVRDIFLKTGLPSATLARIWELCDTSDAGKLTKEQFALALYLINQKLSKGLDPPQALTPEMIPPSDRLSAHQSSTLNSQAADFSAIKELDSLSNEIVDLQREKTTVEQEIKEKEESIKQKSSEVQDLQDEVQRESEELQRLQTQRQEIQEVLGSLEQQKTALEEQLGSIRQQCSQESELINSLQVEHAEQEMKISQFEEDLAQAQEELRKLQLETAHMEEQVEISKAQLDPLEQSLNDSQQEVFKVQQKLSDLQNEEKDIQGQLTWRQHLKEGLVNGAPEDERLKIPEEEPKTEKQEDLYSSSPSVCKENSPNIPLSVQDELLDPEKKPEPQQSSSATESGLDFFQADPFTDNDPFKDDPFAKVDVADPFGGDPFKGTDPFAADSFFKQPSIDPFSSEDPFGGTVASPLEDDLFGSKLNNMEDADPFGNPADSTELAKEVSQVNDPFAPGGTTVTSDSNPDPFASVFGNDSFGGGFADFSSLSKSNGADPFTSNTLSSKNLFKEDGQASPDMPPALPPKTGTPTRPPPPPPGKRCSISRSESSDSFHRKGPFLPQGSGDFSHSQEEKSQDPFAPSSPRQTPRDTDSFASFDKYPTEEYMIEWAKRESEREEKERLARLTQQEQEDLELAIALSKSELS
ncbi:epidermal growth factor receptor substrate 15 isoform X2 [Amia ocellicauda]|uniref:epidermal growth factor receptor substrate 15 isoform X2 n=1 Tax=Amia ocellicauda TaxID=2972642 RepID=UPI003463E440